MHPIEFLIERIVAAAFPIKPGEKTEGKFNGTYLLLLILFFGAAIVALLFAAG